MLPLFAEFNVGKLALSGLGFGGAALMIGGFIAMFTKPKAASGKSRVARVFVGFFQGLFGAAIAGLALACNFLMDGTAPGWLNNIYQSIRS